ncbi:MAG: HIT family protein [Gemmatimonadota bacterium]|nr:MAG: HIT family protein [Gemmatimonadota bacterium]
MSNCVFCDILNGQAEASIVYRDDVSCAFLDLFPANPGHVLVIPAQHAAYMRDLPEETGGYLFRIGMLIAQALHESEFKCEGINYHLADGAAAGQEIFHVHLHIIPRVQGDGFGFKFARGRTPESTRSDLDSVAEKIRAMLKR